MPLAGSSQRQADRPVRRGTCLAALLLGWVMIGACGTGPSSPGSSESAAAMPQPAVSCLALAEPDCTKVGLAVLARLAGRPPVSSILITASGDCAERCPPTLAARPLGDARIESATSISIASWRANQIGGIDVDEPEDAGAFIAAPPDSPPAGGGPTPYSLGHCGLFSGVDVDGSYWDPVGLITDHPAAANSADGVVAFTGPDTAVFRTADGFTVALARHVGPKLSLPCM